MCLEMISSADGNCEASFSIPGVFSAVVEEPFPLSWHPTMPMNVIIAAIRIKNDFIIVVKIPDLEGLHRFFVSKPP